MFVKVNTGALSGIDAVDVTVEVNVAGGGIGLFIVGLPDNTIKESHERIQAAFENSGYRLIAKKTVVNLAPADLRKEGSQYDLAIAIGILVASEQLTTDMLSDSMFIGELSLNGTLRPVKGVLPLVAMARQRGIKRVFMPEENTSEGAIVEGVECVGIRTLLELCEIVSGRMPCVAAEGIIEATAQLEESEYIEDFADVKGQPVVKRALEIAAAGGHNVIMVGAPGSGKTMLARRMPSILPPMTLEEALETTKIHSVAGKIGAHRGLITSRPFRAPHHLTSQVALIGGGQSPQPGEVSLANNGVLFLDEMPEFGHSVLEVLRQPMEDKHITISRVRYTVDYPSNFTLVASMNPCPCGNYGSESECRCSKMQISRYLSKISGPLLDRIDMHIEVSRVKYGELTAKSKAESSAVVRERVEAARELQRERLKGTGLYTNAQLTGSLFDEYCKPDQGGEALLKIAFERMKLSARSYKRILMMARTIADLDHEKTIKQKHIAEAIQYRSLDRKFWGN